MHKMSLNLLWALGRASNMAQPNFTCDFDGASHLDVLKRRLDDAFARPYTTIESEYAVSGHTSTVRAIEQVTDAELAFKLGRRTPALPDSGTLVAKERLLSDAFPELSACTLEDEYRNMHIAYDPADKRTPIPLHCGVYGTRDRLTGYIIAERVAGTPLDMAIQAAGGLTRELAVLLRDTIVAVAEKGVLINDYHMSNFVLRDNIACYVDFGKSTFVGRACLNALDVQGQIRCAAEQLRTQLNESGFTDHAGFGFLDECVE